MYMLWLLLPIGGGLLAHSGRVLGAFADAGEAIGRAGAGLVTGASNATSSVTTAFHAVLSTGSHTLADAWSGVDIVHVETQTHWLCVVADDAGTIVDYVASEEGNTTLPMPPWARRVVTARALRSSHRSLAP